MNIAIFIGKNILYNKSNKYHKDDTIINEYKYLCELAPKIKKELESCGYDCTLYIIPENVFDNGNEVTRYKLSRANLKNEVNEYIYDVVIELHLNYSKNKFHHGICGYYKPNDSLGYSFATRICKAFKEHGFLNLGTNTPNMYMLTATEVPTVIIEMFHSTSIKDINKSFSYGMEKMAEIFVTGINGGPYKKEQVEPNYPIILRNKHGWVKDENNQKKMYYNRSILYKNAIENIYGDYYYFDNKGYISHGFKEINDHIYYFDEEGKMVIDKSISIDGKIYKFNKDGCLVTTISDEDIDRIITDDGEYDTIEGTLVIYSNPDKKEEFAALVNQYPDAYFMLDSDYVGYNTNFTRVIDATDKKVVEI